MMEKFVAKPLYRPDSDALRFLPECPRVLRQFSGNSTVLGWVAIQHAADSNEGSINLLDLATGSNTSLPMPGRPGFFVETTSPGILVAGVDRRLVIVNVQTGDVRETGTTVSQDERVIINDGIAVPGGLLFGTKHLAFDQPLAALYFFDSATRRLQTVLEGQICSNGKFYRRSGNRIILIDIDSLPKTITRYEFDEGFQTVLRKDLVAPPNALPAIPDGLRPSPDGSSIIVAYYNPAEVSQGIAQEIRLSDGAVLTEWVLPGSPRVTCPEFIRSGNEVRLVFTTAVEGMPEAMRTIAPEAGTLYISDSPFTSLPEPPPLFPVEALA